MSEEHEGKRTDRSRRARIVMSVGGSIAVPKGNKVDYLEELGALLGKYIDRHRFILVVGGGRTARRYIKLSRELGADEAYLDEIGIHCSRLNAMLLKAAFPPEVHTAFGRDIEDTVRLSHIYDVVVTGGTHPGHTTDAVATILCERTGADRFINATAVDGIYDRDPEIHPDATRFDEIDATELLSLLMSTPAEAGPNLVVDPLAVRILIRSDIRGCVLDGRDLTELENALGDEGFKGTRIVTSG